MRDIFKVIKLLEFALSIPGTSVEVERLFSLINLAWTDEKSSLEISTLDAILNIQYNCDYDCVKFYNNVKKNIDLLKQVHSSDKYKM